MHQLLIVQVHLHWSAKRNNWIELLRLQPQSVWKALKQTICKCWDVIFSWIGSSFLGVMFGKHSFYYQRELNFLVVTIGSSDWGDCWILGEAGSVWEREGFTIQVSGLKGKLVFLKELWVIPVVGNVAGDQGRAWMASWSVVVTMTYLSLCKKKQNHIYITSYNT